MALLCLANRRRHSYENEEGEPACTIKSIRNDATRKLHQRMLLHPE